VTVVFCVSYRFWNTPDTSYYISVATIDSSVCRSNFPSTLLSTSLDWRCFNSIFFSSCHQL